MYTMKEACKLTNLSYETLKYYCNEGLVPNIKRDKNTIAYLMNIIFVGLTT